MAGVAGVTLCLKPDSCLESSLTLRAPSNALMFLSLLILSALGALSEPVSMKLSYLEGFCTCRFLGQPKVTRWVISWALGLGSSSSRAWQLDLFPDLPELTNDQGW